MKELNHDGNQWSNAEEDIVTIVPPDPTWPERYAAERPESFDSAAGTTAPPHFVNTQAGFEQAAMHAADSAHSPSAVHMSTSDGHCSAMHASQACPPRKRATSRRVGPVAARGETE